jgi:hypothetical protein
MNKDEWLDAAKRLVDEMPRDCKLILRFDSGDTISRVNFGYTAYELLGVHAWDSMDIAAQMHGAITPETINRFFVTGKPQ